MSVLLAGGAAIAVKEVLGGTDAGVDTDLDGLPNDLDDDDDNDGLTDSVENLPGIGTDPLDADSDDDGLLDGEEVYLYETNPNDADHDDDGLSDGDEVNVYFTDPLVSDATLDSDGDGLTNVEEVDTPAGRASMNFSL